MDVVYFLSACTEEQGRSGEVKCVSNPSFVQYSLCSLFGD
jgi:hypothetical protein